MTHHPQAKPPAFIKSKSNSRLIAVLTSLLIIGAVVWTDPADAFSGVHKDCLVTEGRC